MRQVAFGFHNHVGTMALDKAYPRKTGIRRRSVERRVGHLVRSLQDSRCLLAIGSHVGRSKPLSWHTCRRTTPVSDNLAGLCHQEFPYDDRI